MRSSQFLANRFFLLSHGRFLIHSARITSCMVINHQTYSLAKRGSVWLDLMHFVLVWDRVGPFFNKYFISYFQVTFVTIWIPIVPHPPPHQCIIILVSIHQIMLGKMAMRTCHLLNTCTTTTPSTTILIKNCNQLSVSPIIMMAQ